MKYNLSFDFGVASMKFNRLADLYWLLRFVDGVLCFNFYNSKFDMFCEFDFIADVENSKRDFSKLVHECLENDGFFKIRYPNSYGVFVDLLVTLCDD